MRAITDDLLNKTLVDPAGDEWVVKGICYAPTVYLEGADGRRITIGENGLTFQKMAVKEAAE